MSLIGMVLVTIMACKTTKLTEPTSSVIPNRASFTFPMDWLGEYEGTLYIMSSPKDTTAVKMGLSIQNPDNTGLYPWILSYGDADKRYYGLEAINVQKGHYRVDELNSIKLDGYLRGNHFVTRFEVMGSDLLVDYERQPGGILTRFYVSRDQPSLTGGEVFGSDTIPEVKTYPLVVFQEAFLRKKPE